MPRRTYIERLFPIPPSFQDLARSWCEDQSALLLGLVWDAFDRLKREHFDRVPPHRDDDRKEESLNLLFATWIDRGKNSFAPFRVVHEVPEQAARLGGKAKSPCPDIGFCFHDNPRSIWPIEGKILESEDDIIPYCSEITGNFLTGRYATFSNEGAMLGYLFSGEPPGVFGNIRRNLGCRLFKHKSFAERPHRVSSHKRINLPDPASSELFLCHHIIIVIHAASASSI